MPSEDDHVVICRCCVAECKDYKSLHREGIILGEVTTLAALLAFCVSLDFEENKNSGTLPTVICNNCIQELAKSYLFKKKVLESDEALRSQLLDDDEATAERQKEVQQQSEDCENENERQMDGKQAYHNRETTTETDLEELAAAAQLKRELDEQMYEAEEEYEEQLTIIENTEDGVEIEVHQDEDDNEMHDDDGLEYVVQEVAETTEIYHTTEIDHGSKSPHQGEDLEEDAEGMEQQTEECEDEVEYEIHVNEVDDDFNETITDDRDGEAHVEVVKREYSNPAVPHTPRMKGSRSRNRSTNKAPNPNFQCKVCFKQLSNSSSFKYHMQLHSDDTPYNCDVCGESFKTRNAYDGHKRTHDPNNPNTCNLCGKSYRQPSSLRIHMLSHTGEKPFVCNVCGKSLTQKSGYKKHMLTHTGEKPFSCDICGRAFRISSNMLAHRRSHAGEKPHVCVECEKSFGTYEQLKRHMLVHSEEKPFTCDTCGKQFKRQSTLRAHTQSHWYATADETNFEKKVSRSNVVEII